MTGPQTFTITRSCPECDWTVDLSVGGLASQEEADGLGPTAQELRHRRECHS